VLAPLLNGEHPAQRSASLSETRIRASRLFFALVVCADGAQVRVGIGKIGVAYDGTVVGGRYLTHDPVRQFANPYAYGPWDPVNGTDPNGTFFGFDDAIFWAVVGAVFAATAIDVGIRTGDIGAALKAGISSVPGTIAGAQVGGAFLGTVTTVARTAFGPAVAQALAYATVGTAGGYGVYQAASHGYYASAGLGAVLTGFGLQQLYANRAMIGAQPAGPGSAAAGKVDPDDPLLFNQKGLQRVDANGNVLENFGGVSGNGELRSDTPGLSAPNASQVPNQGPIPEGNYTVDPRSIQSFSNLSPSQRWASWRSALTQDRSAPWHFGPPAWGYERVAIQPLAGTNTFGRGGFFVHGGWFPGSSGCIDLSGNASAFFTWLRQQPGPVPLSVRY
jgi:hypothetical protein